MSLSNFLLGRGDFKRADEIIQVANADQRTGGLAPAVETLLIFQTSKQQTWLVASPAYRACVLDDLNKGFTRLQWVIPADELIKDDEVIAAIGTSERSTASNLTGLLHINDRRNWLFSKRLFTSQTIEAGVRDMISRVMAHQNA
jgi:hypothetical protein